MLPQDSSVLRAFLRRHGRLLFFGLLGVLLAEGVASGDLVPGPVDYAFVSALIIRRFGLLRTTLVTVTLLTLAMVAIPPFTCGDRSRAYAAAIKSDLKNLASQQEIYYSDHYMYTTSATDLAFMHSDGVSVTIASVGTGWAAWATHAALGPETGCAIFYGVVPESFRSLGALTPSQAGEIACTDF